MRHKRAAVRPSLFLPENRYLTLYSHGFHVLEGPARGHGLFRSGMHIGHDMIGTMSNTLILAYTGSATGALLTLYSYEMPYLQVMGYNSIVIEILCGLCGTIGVVLTVPIQAAITAFALRGQVR